MELSLTSYHKDLYPVCGLFVEDTQLCGWLDALLTLELDPFSVEIYGLPTRVANQLWGCLVLMDHSLLPASLGKYQSAHMLGTKLIIPEKTKVYPELLAHDFELLFPSDCYVLHPDIGLFKLSEAISLDAQFHSEELSILDSSRPKDYPFISGEISAFSIEPTPKEELKHELESSEKREKFEDKPLSLGEKLRLEFYKKFLITEEGKDGKISLNKRGFALENLAKHLGLSGSDNEDRIMEDFRNLQERNKKEVDKLMDLLKDNPEEALRFAIPLEEHGYTRGETKSEFKMQDRGLDFSLFGGLKMNRGIGGSIDLGDEYFRLRSQYLESAKKLKEKGAYEKAAFVYLKLLKNYQEAGATLREGKKYEKAALIYLEYLKNEQLAAECYEDGKIYNEAIELYSKLEKLEKVGDLYSLLGSRKSASKAYQAQIDKDLERNKYVKAAIISKDKMQNLNYAQELLLNGWNNRIDQYNCLRTYLNNISNADEVWEQLERINREDVDESNDTIFLKVLKDEYSNQDENEKKVKDMAYVLVSDLLEKGRISSQELLSFNKEDSRLRSDTMRYELKKNKNKNRRI